VERREGNVMFAQDGIAFLAVNPQAAIEEEGRHKKEPSILA
jgi:hypothetical protein